MLILYSLSILSSQYGGHYTTTFKAIVKYQHKTKGYVPVPEGTYCIVTKIRPNVVYNPYSGGMDSAKPLEEIVKFTEVGAGGVVAFDFNKTGNDDVVSYRFIFNSYTKNEGTNNINSYVTIGPDSAWYHTLISHKFHLEHNIADDVWEPVTSGEVLIDRETIAVGTDGYFENHYTNPLEGFSLWNTDVKVPNYPGAFGILAALRDNYFYVSVFDTDIRLGRQTYHLGRDHSRLGVTAYDAADGMRKIRTNAAIEDEWSDEALDLGYGSYLLGRYIHSTEDFKPEWGTRTSYARAFLNGFCYAYAAIKEGNPNVKTYRGRT